MTAAEFQLARIYCKLWLRWTVLKGIMQKMSLRTSCECKQHGARASPILYDFISQFFQEMEEEGRRTLQLAQGAVELGKWLHWWNVPTAIVTRALAGKSLEYVF